MLTTTIRKAAMTTAVLGALALGGATIAGAADTSTGTSSTPSASPPHPARPALASDVAAKVKAAALAKVPGATVLRTEAGGPYGTAYHAHIKTADGTSKVVLVDASFEATAVQNRPARGLPGRRPGGRGACPGGPRETALTGDAKEKVEAAVRASYAGATIARTETNGDGRAP